MSNTDLDLETMFLIDDLLKKLEADVRANSEVHFTVQQRLHISILRDKLREWKATQYPQLQLNCPVFSQPNADSSG